MKTALGFFISFILIALSWVSGSAADPDTEAQLDPQVPAASFTDELTTFDSTRWRRSGVWINGGVFANVWLPNHIEFDGGKMSLRLDDKNQSGGNCPTDCNGQQYASGEYSTVAYYGYGCYEARIKPIRQSGVISSLFTYSDSYNKPPDGDGQYLHNEIDVEFLGKDTTRFQANFYTQGSAGHEHIIDLGFDAADTFNNYGFRWADDTIRWYVNGIEVYSVTNNATITVPSLSAGGSQRLFVNAWPVTQDLGAVAWAGAFNYAGSVSAEYEWIRYEEGANCTFTPTVPTSAVTLKSSQTLSPHPTNFLAAFIILLITTGQCILPRRYTH
ncbi:MAG: family 16 glycosylhydrolase [Candidatus Promineifilaceae bacterium]